MAGSVSPETAQPATMVTSTEDVPNRVSYNYPHPHDDDNDDDVTAPDSAFSQSRQHHPFPTRHYSEPTFASASFLGPASPATVADMSNARAASMAAAAWDHHPRSYGTIVYPDDVYSQEVWAEFPSDYRQQRTPPPRARVLVISAIFVVFVVVAVGVLGLAIYCPSEGPGGVCPTV